MEVMGQDTPFYTNFIGDGICREPYMIDDKEALNGRNRPVPPVELHPSVI